MTDHLRGNVFAAVGQTMGAEVTSYQNGRAIVTLDTGERALCSGSYPDLNTHIRVYVEEAGDPHTQLSRRNRDIRVVEVREAKDVQHVWRAPVTSPPQSIASTAVSANGRVIEVVRKRRTRVVAPQTAAS